MKEKIDTRGLSCPQPVLIALSKMQELGTGEIEVLVDNEVSRENISRAATKQGWEVSHSTQKTDEYNILLKR